MKEVCLATNKRKYTSFEEAKSVINGYSNQRRIYKNGNRVNRRQSYKPKRVYKCDSCNMYHLTSKVK